MCFNAPFMYNCQNLYNLGGFPSFEQYGNTGYNFQNYLGYQNYPSYQNYQFFPLKYGYNFNYGNNNLTDYRSAVLTSFPFFQYPFASFTSTSETQPATSSNNGELNPKQKSQMEEIQKLKYDSDDLQTKLKEDKNIKDYASFLESNKDYSVSQTLNSDDGGKIYIYNDKSGNFVGSVSKDAKGNIGNVALGLSDGGELSLNDTGKDGTIDESFATSKNQSTSDKKTKTSYKNILASILKANKGYTLSSKKTSDGGREEHYIKSGKEIAVVLKDKKGAITNINQVQSTSKQNKTQTTHYEDNNHNGIVDDNERKITSTIHLS